MDTWEQFKYVRDLKKRISRNRTMEFLRNYKLSVPVIVGYSALICFTVFLFHNISRDPFFFREPLDEILVSSRSHLVGLGMVIFLMSIYIAGLIGMTLKVFDNSDKGILFTMPIQRRNLMRGKYLGVSLGLFGTGLTLIALIYMGTIPFFGFTPKPLVVMIVFFLIIHVFVNIQLIVMHLEIVLRNNRYWKYLKMIALTTIIVAIMIPFLIMISMIVIQRFDQEVLISLFLSEPYMFLLSVPYVGAVIIIGEAPWQVTAMMWASLIILDVSTTIVFWKANFLFWEEDVKTMGRQLPMGAIRYEGREIPAYPGWWRIGPLKKLRWRLPQIGDGLRSLIAKNKLLSRRNWRLFVIRGMFYITALSPILLFLSLGGPSSGYDVYPLIWFSIMMPIAGIMLGYYSPMSEGRRLEIMKIMPFNGKEIVLSFLKPQVIGALVPYFIFGALGFYNIKSINFLNMFLFLIAGPGILLGVLALFYYLYIRTLHRVNWGKTVLKASIGFLVVAFSLFFIYFAVFFAMIHFRLDPPIVLCSVTAVHWLMALVLFPASFKAFDRTEIRA
jgi:hypothetical protein